MAATQGVYNWLLALGLAFDPAPSDEKTLRDAFEAKRKHANLNNSRNDPQKGEYYKAIADQLDKTEGGTPSVLRRLNDETQREQLADEARQVVYKLMDQFITEAAKGEGREDDIESHKFANIAKVTQKFVQRKTRIPDWECTANDVRKRVEALGLEIIETGQGSASASSKSDEEAAYEPFSKKSKWRSKNWGELDKALGHFGFATIYEYACPPGHEGDPTGAPSAEILQRAENIRDSKKQHNAEKSSAELIASHAKAILQSESTRAEYDEYIEFNAVNDILERFESLVDVGNGIVGDDALNGTIREVAEVIRDKSKAPLVVRGFCRKKNKKFSQQMNAVYCRCGYANALSNSACQGCGLPLQVPCPSCGKKHPNSAEYCDCGAAVGKKLGEVMVLCSSTQKALDGFDLATADALLNQAKTIWPGLSVYGELESKIASTKRRLGPVVEKIDQLVKQKCYIAAKEAIADAKRKHPGFNAPSMEREIAERTAEAERCVLQAGTASNEDERLKLYERALAACADHRDALSYMRSNPPEPPTGLRTVIDATNGSVRLAWNASASHGTVSYTVRRCEGSVPLDESDGVEVASGNVTRAEDAGALPGRPYHYAVFAVRCGIPSSALSHPDPIHITSEISDLVATPGDGVVEFRWKKSNAFEVEIEEFAPERKAIARTKNGFHTHSGLQNGTTYAYRVRAVYRIEGKEHRTDGLAVEATPIDTSESIVDFRAVRSRAAEHVFELSWTEPPNSTVKLFSSSNREDVPDKGVVLSLGEIESRFTDAGGQRQKWGAATLQYSGDSPIFVFPVLVYGKTAVVGNCARVFSKEEIRITDVQRMNDDVVIRIEPPAKAVAFVVLCRSDRFVRDVSESGKDGDQSRRQIPLKAYERDGALRIKYAGARDYYISVCAVYGSPSAPTYSELTEFLFSTKPKAAIRYSIRAMKIPFIGVKVTLSFYADSPKFELPQTVVEYGIGGLPVFSGSGTQVAIIPAQEVSGTLDFEVNGLPNRKGIYLKAFPADGTINSYVLDPHSNCKVS